MSVEKFVSECCKTSISQIPVYDDSTMYFPFESSFVIFVCDKCDKPCKIIKIEKMKKQVSKCCGADVGWYDYKEMYCLEGGYAGGEVYCCKCNKPCKTREIEVR